MKSMVSLNCQYLMAPRLRDFCQNLQPCGGYQALHQTRSTIASDPDTFT